MNKSFRVIGKVLLFIAPIMSGCAMESLSNNGKSERTDYVSLIASAGKIDFLLRPAQGQFTDNRGTSLSDFLEKLDEETGVVNVRLIPFSKSAEELSNAIINTRLPFLSPQYEVTARGFSTAAQLETIRIEILRYGARFDGCRPHDGNVKFGCAVDVNRALSLVNIQEIEFAHPLAPAVGELGISSVSRLLSGNAAALPQREK